MNPQPAYYCPICNTSWAAYQDTARRVYVNGGQAANVRDAERRGLQGIDDDFHDVMPLCLTGMGCLCAGHARGDAPQVRCDTNEQPGARPEPATAPRAVGGVIKLDATERGIVRNRIERDAGRDKTPTLAQWHALRHTAQCNDRGAAAQTLTDSTRTARLMQARGWVVKRDGYRITDAGRAALKRGDRRHPKDARAGRIKP